MAAWTEISVIDRPNQGRILLMDRGLVVTHSQPITNNN